MYNFLEVFFISLVKFYFLPSLLGQSSLDVIYRLFEGLILEVLFGVKQQFECVPGDEAASFWVVFSNYDIQVTLRDWLTNIVHGGNELVWLNLIILIDVK